MSGCGNYYSFYGVNAHCIKPGIREKLSSEKNNVFFEPIALSGVRWVYLNDIWSFSDIGFYLEWFDIGSRRRLLQLGSDWLGPVSLILT